MVTGVAMGVVMVMTVMVVMVTSAPPDSGVQASWGRLGDLRHQQRRDAMLVVDYVQFYAPHAVCLFSGESGGPGEAG